MRCTFCDGTGKAHPGSMDWSPDGLPCPDCGGTGILHCCEGEQCQPDKYQDRSDEHR